MRETSLLATQETLTLLFVFLPLDGANLYTQSILMEKICNSIQLQIKNENQNVI